MMRSLGIWPQALRCPTCPEPFPPSRAGDVSSLSDICGSKHGSPDAHPCYEHESFRAVRGETKPGFQGHKYNSFPIGWSRVGVCLKVSWLPHWLRVLQRVAEWNLRTTDGLCTEPTVFRPNHKANVILSKWEFGEC